MGICIQRVNKTFGEPATHVLKDISLDIKDGDFVALTGRSGSGKSTLLYILSTLDSVTSGSVSIDGKEVRQMNLKEVHRFRNLNAGFVFQFHYLLPELTALENVLLPAIKTGKMNPLQEEAKRLLSDFELGDKINRFPSQLSGGEQQRVAIARALLMRPKYLFADEPTGNLDSSSGDIVMNLIEKINRERGTTVIMVTHDPDYAKRATRQVFMVDGKLN